MHLLNMDAASQNSSYLRISSIKTRNASSASGSEIETIQMARQSLKECSEKKCIEFENGLEAELKEKIHYGTETKKVFKTMFKYLPCSFKDQQSD